MNFTPEQFDDIKGAIRTAFDKHTGRNSTWPTKELAAALGWSEAKVWALKRGDLAMRANEFVAVASLLPAEFLSEVFAPYGLAFERIATNLQPCPIAAQESALDFSHEVSKALANDRRICAKEWPVLVKKARDVLRRFVPIAKGSSRPVAQAAE